MIPRESTRKRTSSLCTPPPSISKKKVSNKINSLDVDKKSLKRSKSTSNLIPTTSGTARKRSRTKTFDITDEVKDTDPSHPTSSVNLRIKGRTLKGSKKLTDMGPLIHHEKLQLDDSSIITDCVKGEILMYKSRMKESYFRVSADFSTVDGVSDKEDDGQPTSSETLRKKGRNNKGKKKLVPFPPMHLYHEETVEGNMVNLYEPQVQSKDSYFKISSN